MDYISKNPFVEMPCAERITSLLNSIDSFAPVCFSGCFYRLQTLVIKLILS